MSLAGERRGAVVRPPTPLVAGLTAAAAVVLGLTAVLALLGLPEGERRPDLVVVAHAAAGAGAAACAALLALLGWAELERRLVLLAPAFALLVLAAVLRGAGVGPGGPTTPDSTAVGAVVALAWQAAVPLQVAALGRRPGTSRALAASALLLLATVLAVAAAPALDLVTDGERLAPRLRVAYLLLGLATLGVWARWRRLHGPRPHPADLAVALALGLGAAVSLARSAVEARYTTLWWWTIALEALALVLPALLLLVVAARGYASAARLVRSVETALAEGTVPLHAAAPGTDGPDAAELDDVLRREGLSIVVQPVVDLRDGRVLGVEALSRVDDPAGRGPAVWFAAARRHGCGTELEHLALRCALQLLPSLPEEQFLAVNVSSRSLADGDVQRLLRTAPLDRVVLEITEHEAVADYAALRGALDGLRSAGARVAVDDAGAGWASLRHVLQLRPDVVKLDGSLVEDLPDRDDARALARSLAQFATAVGALAVAECVERPEQRATLRDLGVGAGQGFLLGAPAPPRATA